MPNEFKIDLKDVPDSQNIQLKMVDGKIYASFKYDAGEDRDFGDRERTYENWDHFNKDADSFFNLKED